MRSEWHPPIYVLVDLSSKKTIGYYGITEADDLERDSKAYLLLNPHISRKDIALTIDRLGFSLPPINEIEEFL